jgi:hypothetical protein
MMSRIDRIEQLLEENLQGQITWREDIKTAMSGLIEAQTATQRSFATLNESISRYVDSADARTKRLEENLDALIKAITAEHSNGKGKH